jgi:tRNA(fMet)-specific endonuclease VapC
MIALDRDVLAKLSAANEAVIRHLSQYSNEEWTVPALVAWESYKAQDSRADMQRTQRVLRDELDRVLDISDETALEAAYLDEKLRSQDVDMPPVDLLNLATAYAEGGTFVTHNKSDFDRQAVHSLADVDIVYTSR